PLPHPPTSTLFPYTTLFRSNRKFLFRHGDSLSQSRFLAKCWRENREPSNGGSHAAQSTPAHGGFHCPAAGILVTRHGSAAPSALDRKSTRLNSSHVAISYAV